MAYVEFEAGKKFARKGADTSDDLNSFKDAGYLLNDSDVIIDIDCFNGNYEPIKRLIQFFDIKTQVVYSPRGAHIYFKKPMTFTRAKNGVCALGFPIEMKTKQNTPNGITIKQNGVAREIENEGLRQELPLIFYKNKKFENLLGVGESDGRNNKLFAHKMKLENMENWLKCLRFINDFIFDKPLEESEFQTVCREQDINNQDVTEATVTALIMNQYNVVYYANDLWFKYDDWYSNDYDELINIVYSKVPAVQTRFVDEVIKQLRYKCKRIRDDQILDVKFPNAILRNGQVIYVESEEFTPYFVDVVYNPEAKPVKIVDDYITQLTKGDEEYRKFLIEVLGYSFETNPEFIRNIAKFFIFRGNGSNGKGTLLQIIKEILQEKNCSGKSLKQLGDERYLPDLKNKLVNLADDIENEPITRGQMKVIKNISTCDYISVRELYKKSKDVMFRCKLFFTSNYDLRSMDKDNSYKRRVKWMPMFTEVKKPDPNFITKLTTPEALEYWIRLFVEGYLRLHEQGCFSECAIVDEFNEEYHNYNNVTKLFIEEIGVDVLLGKKISEVKDMYSEWAEGEDEERKFSKNLFINTLWNEYKIGIGVKSIEGKKVRVLLRDEDTDQSIEPKFKQ